MLGAARVSAAYYVVVSEEDTWPPAVLWTFSKWPCGRWGKALSGSS